MSSRVIIDESSTTLGAHEENPIEIDSSDTDYESSNAGLPVLETNVKVENGEKRSGEDGDEEASEGDNENESDDEDEHNDDDSVPEDSKDPDGTARSSRAMWGGIESMLCIEKSPYEGDECAEVGEDCFEQLREFMNTEGKINPKMEVLMGGKLAGDLCKAYSEIGKSGMLYSANWREGKIRESDFGWMPKRQLLLCLHEQRFARANQHVLQAVAKSLDCTGLVLEAMKMWNFTEDYPKLASTSANDSFVFATQKTSCYKCEIFVARTFAALQILNKTHEMARSTDLWEKTRKCLTIMNTHVRPNQIELAKIHEKSQKRSEVPSARDRAVSRKTRWKPEKIGNERKVTSSSRPYPGPPAQKPAKRRPRENKVADKDSRKRHRVVPKSEGERKETLTMYFDHLNRQAKHVNDMMSFFQKQLHDHRKRLKKEIREEMENEKKDKR